MANIPHAYFDTTRTPHALSVMDSAAEFVRTRLGRILPVYLLAMVPFSVVVMIGIDLVTSQHRAMTSLVGWCLVLATLWRWGWIAVLQRRVQSDIRGGAPKPIRGHLFSILFLRSLASACALWGSILIVPGMYGFLMGGMITPLRLEPSEGAWSQIKRVSSWVAGAQTRLLKLLTALGVLYVLALVSVYALMRIVLTTLLPTFLGLNPSDLDFTLGSWTGIIIVSYLVGLILDLYWSVLSVMVFYELQSRRLAPDLRVRLRSLRESSSS